MVRKKRNYKKKKVTPEKVVNISSKEEEIIESYIDVIDEDDYNDEDVIVEEEYSDNVEEKDPIIIVEEDDTVEAPVLTKVIEEYDSTEEFEESFLKKMKDTEKEEKYSYDEDEYYEKDNNFKWLFKKILSFIIVLIIASVIMVIIDVVAITKYDKGPYFAYPVKTYDDGGTTEYYGIGYKVIDYYQLQGRRDRELGLWSMKYNSEPVTFQDIDMAIDIYGKEDEFSKKYNKKFVRIISNLEKIDKENEIITIGYNDEGKKYSLKLVCLMTENGTKLDKLKEHKEITIIGTITDIKKKTKKNPTTIYINNCFAEQ